MNKIDIQVSFRRGEEMAKKANESKLHPTYEVDNFLYKYRLYI